MAEQSNILKNGSLISYDGWSTYIDSLRTNITINDEDKAVDLLLDLLDASVKKRIPDKRFGILFSGGVDSTFIAYTAKKYTKDFICYTVGIEGSKDILESMKIAKELGLVHRKKILTLKETSIIFEDTAKILGKNLINIVNVGVGAVVLAAIKLAKEDNVATFFTGLGSEEIFAGYQRHEKSSDINEECWNGLKSMWERDFRRDYSIAKATGSEFLTPFLDKELIIAAMQIDGNLKIKDNIKKYILRQTALSSGLKKEFAFRPKSAAQYGSSFDKAITRIAKSKGFRYKKGYLDYLRSM